MKAIIADVDDTICPSTRPVAVEMGREIDRMISAGKIFAFISGGTLEQLLGQLSAGLSWPFHVLAASGTHYASVSYNGGKPVAKEIYRELLDPGMRDEIVAALAVLIEKYQIKTMTTREDQLQDRGSQITLSALGRHAPDQAKRALDPDGSKRHAWIEFLKERLGDKYSMRIGGTSSIDITQKGMDKAWGVRRFLEIQKLLPSEVLYFGDKLGSDGNDYPVRSILDCMQVSSERNTLEIFKNLLV